MQIKIRRMTLTDLILNYFYRVRFWFFRNFCKKKLSNQSPTYKEGWDITFEDEFNEVSWGKSESDKWLIGEGWGLFHPDKPNVWYGPPELIENSSCAKFSVKYNPRLFPDDYRTGNPILIPGEVSLLSTQKSFKQQYGRFECRFTLPQEPYTWPAFWTWGSTWPPEIDIWEPRGGDDGSLIGRNVINLHYGKTSDGTKSSSRGWKYWITRKPKAGKFHELACEWGPDKIEVFQDGIKVYRFTLKETLEWFNAETAKQWIVINHSVQASFSPDENYHSEFLVDYIRAYKKIN